MAIAEQENGRRAGLAAEYALGTLDASEKADAEASLRTDKAFAAEVDEWQGRFDPLLDAIAPAEPPLAALGNIMSAIEERPVPEIIQLRRTVRTLTWIAGAAIAIAASLIAIVVLRSLEDRGHAQFVAVLEGADRTPAFVATADLAKGSLYVHRVGPAPSANRSYELWAIKEASAPLSLGVVDNSLTVSLDKVIPPRTDLSISNVLLAITDEPEGGSPNGKPSSAPIFTGKLAQAPLI